MESNQTIFSSVTLVKVYEEDRFHSYNVCLYQPMKIVSEGIWTNHTYHIPSQSAFTMLELQIITIFLITQTFHFLLKRLGVPYFVSQVMAGFLLGPSIKTGPMEKYKMMLFPFGSADILNTISSFGYGFFLFLNSVQMDITLIKKTGKKAWVIALSSYFIPIIGGFFILGIFSSLWKEMAGSEEMFGMPVVFISHSGCSFAAISLLLNELGILNSELGRLTLSAAFLVDLTGGIGAGFAAAIISSMQSSSDPGSHLFVNLIAFFVILLVIPVIARPAMRWVVKNTPEGRHVNKIYIHIILVVFLLMGFLAGHFNQPFLAGAVIFGLCVPEGPPLGSELVYRFELFSTWFLSPIFVTCCAMKVDLTKCGPTNLILVVCCFIVLIHFIKLLVCVVICRFCRMPSTDGFCLALILSSKGVVDLCSYILVYDGMGQSKASIGVMVVSVLILGTTSKLGVKALYDPARKYAGYQKRNIMNLKQNSELRIVACIYKPHHTIVVKNVLQLCSPAPDNTLVADVVHLMELVGRSTPIFIAHKLQQSVGSSYNYSGEVIVTFDLFEREHAGSAIANTYTAISPAILMHEDVCHLALDKIASLIILPFHVKWGGDGSIESEDSNIRALNSKVLERAPCSVGILLNRGSSFNSTCYNVAMIFLGGPDDREALCLAKRFVRNVDNNLYVYRLLGYDHDSSNWENMIDDEELRELRGAYVRQRNARYEERTIDDASETTTFIKDIAKMFDFIIVGRRNGVRTSQTLGLESWTEYSELGVIGDLLASSDMETKASILVVQQQQTPYMCFEDAMMPQSLRCSYGLIAIDAVPNHNIILYEMVAVKSLQYPTFGIIEKGFTNNKCESFFNFFNKEWKLHYREQANPTKQLLIPKD
ncbi:hypothetical protein VNO77_42774 [Canavalia gladiata]|uniref:Cation/H+ exchanger domain-containing protein n=1 Tax=Canavalia gladiata TaxID=3824 RepID=A0AAN9PNR9_CANGL